MRSAYGKRVYREVPGGIVKFNSKGVLARCALKLNIPEARRVTVNILGIEAGRQARHSAVVLDLGDWCYLFSLTRKPKYGAFDLLIPGQKPTYLSVPQLTLRRSPTSGIALKGKISGIQVY